MMMRALTTFDYNGCRYHAGDVFEPHGDDGKVLALARLAVEEDDKPKKSERQSKKRYQRADLRAEDE